jgi:hypothetical protein
VDPSISVPMDESTERKLIEQYVAMETVHKPLSKPTTQASATGVSTTGPATGVGSATSMPVVDNQLQTAVKTMVGMIAIGANPTASSQPATRAADRG